MKLLYERNNDKLQPYWDMYLHVLKMFKGEVESHGSKFLFIMIPDESQISRYKNAYSKALVGDIRKDGVSHIDMLPELRKFTKLNKMSYYNSPYDFHLNKFGNTIVANAVSNAIVDRSEGNRFTFEVDNTSSYRMYRNEIKAEIRIDENSNFSIAHGAEIAKASVVHENIDTECSETLGSTICLAYPAGHAAVEGVLSIVLEYTMPVSSVTVFNPRKVGDPGSGSITVYCTPEGQEERVVSHYANADKNIPDGLENVEFVEVDFPQATNHVTVRYLLQGDAALFASENINDDLRKLQIIGYP